MHRCVTRPLAILAALLLAAPRASAGDEITAVQAPAIDVLILSGQNNHRWQQTTPKLKEILEADGLCRVDVVEKPDDLTAEKFRKYDVLLSNWNTYGGGRMRITDWPDDVKQAYLQFVAQGKGHVVVHAGSSSFPKWDEYHKLTLATWKGGETGHGKPHDFEVRLDTPDHPITHDLQPFTTFDELWHRAGVQEHATVLASAYASKDKGGTDAWEPIAFAAPYGKGRTFTLLLGHDAKMMESDGFQQLLRRGTEWAATGKVAPPHVRRPKPKQPDAQADPAHPENSP